MKLNKQIIYGVFIVFGFIGLVLIFSEVIQYDQRTSEGKLIIEACEDIKAHEILRARSDFHALAQTIYGHVHSYRDESDTVLAKAVMEIRELQEEAEFRNENTPMYHQKFSDVLNRLSYLELEDAIYFTEHNQIEKASGAIHRAQHYLHDAMSLSMNPGLNDQKKLLHVINGLNDKHPNKQDLEQGLQKVKKLI